MKIDKIKLPNTKIKLLQQLLVQPLQKLKKVNKVKEVDFSKKMQSFVEHYNKRKEDDVLRSEVYEEMANKFTDLICQIKQEFSVGDALGIDFEQK